MSVRIYKCLQGYIQFQTVLDQPLEISMLGVWFEITLWISTELEHQHQHVFDVHGRINAVGVWMRRNGPCVIS